MNCSKSFILLMGWMRKNEQAGDENRFTEIVQTYRRHHIEATIRWLNQQLEEMK